MKFLDADDPRPGEARREDDDKVESSFTRLPFSLSKTGSFWFSSDGRYSPTVLERDPDLDDSDDRPEDGLLLLLPFALMILSLYLASCSMNASIVDAGWKRPSAAAFKLNSSKIGLCEREIIEQRVRSNGRGGECRDR